MWRRKERACVCVAAAVACTLLVIVVCSTRLVELRCAGDGRDDAGGAGAFRRAAVAADSDTCSNIGRDMLHAGGSAVDGAIAALLCTAVVNPQSMGIGGGVIFTIMQENGKVRIINARESVPERVKADLLSDCSSSSTPSATGVEWIGVPGEIRGYERAHRLFGRLPWSDLFQPTIRLAREGVPMSELLQRILSHFNNSNLPFSQLFMDAEGKMLKKGDKVKFEKLADTLELISKNGSFAFYQGDVASDLVSDIQAAGGTLTLEDLKDFEVQESEAWSSQLEDYTMYFPPPPAGGAALSFILNVMQGYNLNPASLQEKQRVQTLHRYVETCKFANSLKKLLKDPRFASTQEASAMTREEFAAHVRSLITDGVHLDQYYNTTPGVDTPGTTHVSVLDENGMAVSVTSTINHIFGSKVYSPKTGVLLNNELADFCWKTNRIQPGEQPPSSMAPVILHSKTDKHTIIIGGSGGSMITSAVAMTLMNYLWFGKSLKDSVADPIVYVDSKNALKFEPKFDQQVKEALRKLGHTVEETRFFYNVVNVVSRQEEECIEAVSDARKMGKPAGY